jgi:cysteine synthase A
MQERPDIDRDVTGTIGGTPVIRLRRLSPSAALYAKLEARNPGGSVKDRLALGIIEDAERSGALRPGQTVVEASSGNTGISLAVVCAARGYPLVVVMAEQFSVERRKLMRFLGARVVLTPAAAKGSGMVEKARELAQAHGWFWCRQFENPANAEAHARTTAVEILRDFAGRPLDYLVLGAGTGGTLRGVGRAMRAERPEVRIVVCEPDNVPLLASGLPQPRHPDGSPSASHAAFRPHPMQGWTPDFIALHTGEAVASGYVDRVLPVPGDAALRGARDLARVEGVLAGITSGATVAGGLQLAREAPGASILCLLPDTGERYLSTPLFEDVPTDMDADEWAISRSTPGVRFDAPPSAMTGGSCPLPAAPPATDVGDPAYDAQALADVDALLDDPSPRVLVFALAWCEFCWSVRRLMERTGIPMEAIELDSAARQADGSGARLRRGLALRTGRATIPQVFVGGQSIGGCSDTFDAFEDGRLARALHGWGIAPAPPPGFVARALLPAWQQPVPPP